jgi:hypothetical protein
VGTRSLGLMHIGGLQILQEAAASDTRRVQRNGSSVAAWLTNGVMRIGRGWSNMAKFHLTFGTDYFSAYG